MGGPRNRITPEVTLVDFAETVRDIELLQEDHDLYFRTEGEHNGVQKPKAEAQAKPEDGHKLL